MYTKILNILSKIFAAAVLLGMNIIAYAARPIDTLRRSDMEFLTSSEASRIGEQVLAYQRVTGGWPTRKPVRYGDVSMTLRTARYSFATVTAFHAKVLRK